MEVRHPEELREPREARELREGREPQDRNRAKAKAGVMSIVDVLQAEAAVASRVEQVLVAEKAIRDQEDQLRRLLNPGEEELRAWGAVSRGPAQGPAGAGFAGSGLR